MLDCGAFYRILNDCSIDFFTGVPDSLLRNICAYISDHAPASQHIIAANEGGAIALAAGYYLATGRSALVYMQNSGQGNAINPLASLADAEVYGIPMLLLIGWRGEPGIKDEPQHLKQGKITLPLLEAMNIAYRILPDNDQEARVCLDMLLDESVKSNTPVALVVRKGTFGQYAMQNATDDGHLSFTREEAISRIVSNLGESDIIVSTTGRTSRELYEHRERLGDGHSQDFLTVGSMGHTSQIAMGIALNKPLRQVFCLDGDGSVLMHMGAMAIIGSEKVNNFKHIILNNGVHDSVGGQPTAGFCVSFTEIARACGYKSVFKAKTDEDLQVMIGQLQMVQGPALLEVLVKKGTRADLGRPKTSPQENKACFMKFLTQ